MAGQLIFFPAKNPGSTFNCKVAECGGPKFWGQVDDEDVRSELRAFILAVPCTAVLLVPPPAPASSVAQDRSAKGWTSSTSRWRCSLLNNLPWGDSIRQPRHPSRG